MGRAFDQHRVLHPAGMVIVGMAAVFGGAVQVPICHAIAGCRNDGSYELHSASSIAYTGPKSEWVDSPAHLAESVQIAIRPLASRNLALPLGIPHLCLAMLLRSRSCARSCGGPPTHRRQPSFREPWVCKQIQSRPSSEFALTPGVCGTYVLLPLPDTTLQPGDRLLFVVQQDAAKELSQYLSPGRLKARKARSSRRKRNL